MCGECLKAGAWERAQPTTASTASRACPPHSTPCPHAPPTILGADDKRGWRPGRATTHLFTHPLQPPTLTPQTHQHLTVLGADDKGDGGQAVPPRQLQADALERVAGTTEVFGLKVHAVPVHAALMRVCVQVCRKRGSG